MCMPPTVVDKPPIVAAAVVVEGHWVWPLRQLKWVEQQQWPL